MTLLKGAALVKTGAEGVFCAAIPGRGLGVALKCDDGATRAAEAMMAAVLARLLPEHEEALRRWTQAPVPTRRGVQAGEVRAVAEAFAGAQLTRLPCDGEVREGLGAAFGEVAGRDLLPAHAEDGALLGAGDQVVGDDAPGRRLPPPMTAMPILARRMTLPVAVTSRRYGPQPSCRPQIGVLDDVAGDRDVGLRADAGADLRVAVAR